MLVPWNLNRVPSKSKGHEPAAESSESHREIHNRYYHLFRGGELEGLVQEAFDGVHGGFSAPKVESGYDRDNWFIIVTLPK